MAVRKYSECVDSITVFSITESYEDYDIIDSQVINIIETGQALETCINRTEKDEDLEWTVLSVNDVAEDNFEKCTWFFRYFWYWSTFIKFNNIKSNWRGRQKFYMWTEICPNV